jgi:predicted exporter
MINSGDHGVYGLGFMHPEAMNKVQDWAERNAPDSVFPFDPGTSFSKEIMDLKVRFSLLLGLDVLLVFLFLAWALRSPVRSALAMLPSLAGLSAVLCVFVLFNKPLNLLHLMSMVIVVSAGVDYGIFAVMSTKRAGTTAKGVLAAASTTLFSFGLFAFLSNPALHSIGITVILGIGISMAVSLLFLTHANKFDREKR